MMMMMKMKIVALIFPGRLLHLGQMILLVGSPSSGTKRKDRRIVAFRAFNGTAVNDPDGGQSFSTDKGDASQHHRIRNELQTSK